MVKKATAEKSTAKKQLEDLFRGVKKAKVSVAPVEEAPKKRKEQVPKGSADNLFGTEVNRTTSRKVTEEGWPVYSLVELGLSNTGGDTKECPFDCSCCY